MAAKRMIKHGRAQAEEYVNRIAAFFFLLSFVIISISVMGIEASAYRRIMYITFDSLAVFFVMAAFRWIIAKILTIYEEIDGGQG